jgi:pimeloyl-ACP methyl ester carboxylesterase
LDVSENPDRPQGRRLSIGVAVVPAASMQALPDPIVVLMGGPGEDAISAAALFAHRFSSLLQHRDLLLVDQRGTGRSGALRCELYSVEDPAPNLRDLFPSEAAARCARQLSKRADLTQYSYTHFASDLEHIRRALAYGPMNLFAGSYGTRAAQVYVRSYPASVRTVYFGSVVPIDVPTPLTFAKTTDHAIETLFDACSAAPSCRDAFPKLRGEFDAIVAQLDKGVRVQVPARTGEAPLHRGRVIEWFRSRLYRPASATRLPLMIHRAYLGDWRPIVEGILDNAAELNAELSVGLLFAITCSEDVAAIREEDIARETAKTALGDYRVRQQQTACSHWPKTSLPRSYRAPVHSSVPALFVSGDMDGASPLWFTERVAPGFSHRLEVVLAGKGHTEWSDCLAELYGRFVRSGATDGLESSSCEPAVRPPFETQ